MAVDSKYQKEMNEQIAKQPKLSALAGRCSAAEIKIEKSEKRC